MTELKMSTLSLLIKSVQLNVFNYLETSDVKTITALPGFWSFAREKKKERKKSKKGKK